jgi:protein ImuA
MPPVASNRSRNRTQVVHELRRLLAQDSAAAACTLPFGLPALDRYLPQGGLSCGALHEVMPQAHGDMPAAFGFLIAILATALGTAPDRTPRAPVMLVTSPGGHAGHGRPYGHGLNGFGLDPARVILVETADDKEALWAMEEALRSGAPSAVAGIIGKLDFQASQRLHLAAGESGRLLLLLRPGGATSVAVTRWRVAAVRAAHDRFGLIARWRWRVSLERCRNGRPGQWEVEFDHATHRFSLAAALAHSAVSRGPGAHPLPSLPRERGRVREGAG